MIYNITALVSYYYSQTYYPAIQYFKDKQVNKSYLTATLISLVLSLYLATFLNTAC